MSSSMIWESVKNSSEIWASSIESTSSEAKSIVVSSMSSKSSEIWVKSETGSKLNSSSFGLLSMESTAATPGMISSEESLSAKFAGLCLSSSVRETRLTCT